MKQWWLNLAERERRILLLGTAAVLFALLYWGGWAPLQQHLQQSRHQVQQLQQQLNWMHQQAPLLRQLKQTAPINAVAESCNGIYLDCLNRIDLIASRFFQFLPVTYLLFQAPFSKRKLLKEWPLHRRIRR